MSMIRGIWGVDWGPGQGAGQRWSAKTGAQSKCLTERGVVSETVMGAGTGIWMKPSAAVEKEIDPADVRSNR